MNLYKGKYWDVIYVDWCQEFPGQCIISSDKESLSDLESCDWIELGIIENELERIVKKLFDSTMYNFACLMNNAFRDKKKPNVHFHFIPRYDGERNILGKKYKDKHFGFNMWKWSNNKFKRQKDIFSKEDKLKIFKMMKGEWNIK